MKDFVFRVSGLGFTVQGLGFRVSGLGFRVYGLGFPVLAASRIGNTLASQLLSKGSGF